MNRTLRGIRTLPLALILLTSGAVQVSYANMSGDPVQRRRYPRYRCELSVTLYLGSGIIQSSIVNISRGGCLLFPPFTPQGSPEVKLSFFLENGQPPVNCKGEVVYTIGDRGTGVAFTEISLFNQDRITAYFDKLAAAGEAVAV